MVKRKVEECKVAHYVVGTPRALALLHTNNGDHRAGAAGPRLRRLQMAGNIYRSATHKRDRRYWCAAWVGEWPHQQQVKFFEKLQKV